MELYFGFLRSQGPAHAGWQASAAPVFDEDLRLSRIFATVVDCQGSGGADGVEAERAVDRQRHSSGWECGCATAAAVVSWTDKGAICYREGQLLFAVVEASSFPDSSGSRSAGGIVTVNGRNEASGAFFVDALQGGLIVADQEELEMRVELERP